MTLLSKTLIVGTVLGLSLAAAPAMAGKKIEQACNASERRAANSQLCHCIQVVANKTLTRSDQKLAASFFKDPHKAQEVRMSDRRRDEKFWLRYKQFGAAAARSCR